MKEKKNKVIKVLKRKIQLKNKNNPFLTEKTIEKTLKISWVRKLIEELKDM